MAKRLRDLKKKSAYLSFWQAKALFKLWHNNCYAHI